MKFKSASSDPRVTSSNPRVTRFFFHLFNVKLCAVPLNYYWQALQISYVYYLSRGFIVSIRAFDFLTRAFCILTRRFELITRGFELVTRGFELVTRNSCFTFPDWNGATLSSFLLNAKKGSKGNSIYKWVKFSLRYCIESAEDAL